jgi:hypothetical protein
VRLQTVVRDCLFLNWALRPDALPAPPEPLRYDAMPGPQGAFVFVSAVLFRQEGMHFTSLPLPRLSYPQCNVRACVLDGDGVPSVWFWRELVPLWVVPGARLIGSQPASPASFDYPQPSREPDAEGWTWRVDGDGKLTAKATRGASAITDGPSFASWNALVERLRQRPRGYIASAGGLHRVETAQPEVPVWPLRAEVEEAGLVAEAAPGTTLELPRLHSAWLCPEIPFVFDLAAVPQALALPTRMPAPG